MAHVYTTIFDMIPIESSKGPGDTKTSNYSTIAGEDIAGKDSRLLNGGIGMLSSFSLH